jgi:hypothetical protein
MFSNHVYKIIILPTLVIRIPNLEIFLFCQHNSTGGGNLELRQTIVDIFSFGLSLRFQGHSLWENPTPVSQYLMVIFKLDNCLEWAGDSVSQMGECFYLNLENHRILCQKIFKYLLQGFRIFMKSTVFL